MILSIKKSHATDTKLTLLKLCKPYKFSISVLKCKLCNLLVFACTLHMSYEQWFSQNKTRSEIFFKK